MPKEEYLESLRNVDVYYILSRFIFPVLVVASLLTCVFCFCQPLCARCFGCHVHKRRPSSSSSYPHNEVQYSPASPIIRSSRWGSSSSAHSPSNAHTTQSSNHSGHSGGIYRQPPPPRNNIDYHYNHNPPPERYLDADEEDRLVTLGESAHHYRSFPVSTAAVVASDSPSSGTLSRQALPSSQKSSPMNPDHRPVIYI